MKSRKKPKEPQVFDLGWCIGKVKATNPGLKDSESTLTIVSPDLVEEGVYSPSTTVVIYGNEQIKALMDNIAAWFAKEEEDS